MFETATTGYENARTSSLDVKSSGVGAISQEYGELTQALMHLDESVTLLRQKLEPILGVDMRSEKDATDAAPRPALSPFAESLRSDAAKIRNIRRFVEDMVNRIEL